jgi:hypothetical protein
MLFGRAASKVFNKPALELSKTSGADIRGAGRITVDAREKD